MARMAVFKVCLFGFITMGTRAAQVLSAKSGIENAQEGNGKGTGCSLMLVTSFFTKMKDWQQDVFHKPTFDKFSEFYNSALQQGTSVTVMYDWLPIEILMTGNSRFRFEQVTPEDYDALEGVNDVRYSIAESWVRQHPEWRYVFMLDLFDTVIARNPCLDVSDDILYAGIEPNPVKLQIDKTSFLSQRFHAMGGKYEKWWQEVSRTKPRYILSAGIAGGHRDIMLTFLSEMNRLLADPNLAVRQAKKEENVNMAVFNYLLREIFQNNDTSSETPSQNKVAVHTGPPVHSVYWGWERSRKDVWFIHK